MFKNQFKKYLVNHSNFSFSVVNNHLLVLVPSVCLPLEVIQLFVCLNACMTLIYLPLRVSEHNFQHHLHTPLLWYALFEVSPGIFSFTNASYFVGICHYFNPVCGCTTVAPQVYNIGAGMSSVEDCWVCPTVKCRIIRSKL